MDNIFGDLPAISLVFLALALMLALGFEFVNGFHDTANAVATVIYTNTLEPTYAVIWSGMWNLIGVLSSSGAVAFGIIALLPVELVINAGSGAGFAMVFALLISAIVWNVGTWYLGLPASSSHTLIGSILGVGLANSVFSGMGFGNGVNWAKAQEVFTSLLVSPVVGFTAAALLLLAAKAVVNIPELYTAPEGNAPPPTWIRGLLMLTCTGVSFAHGSNDGQKGMGLIMLILVGIIPGMYALDLSADVGKVLAAQGSARAVLAHHGSANIAGDDKTVSSELSEYLRNGKDSPKTFDALVAKSKTIETKLVGKTKLKDIPKVNRGSLRSDIYLVEKSISKMLEKEKFKDPTEANALKEYTSQLKSTTEFIPNFVKVAVAVALGLGTMIGWKRIVVTVGEKIGKDRLTYAQGAAAELVAMTTIGAADMLGLPVSTTHVLSSGIAGTMTANASGIQQDTVRSLLLAWVLTLPVCMLLGSLTFGIGLLVTKVLGLS
jgi:inorganic phosphate transporter, PiT family